MTNKEQFDKLIVKYYDYLLLSCRKYVYKNQIKESPEALLNFCLIQVYNKIDKIDPVVFKEDSVFKSYMYKVIQQQATWKTSPFNKETDNSKNTEVEFDIEDDSCPWNEIELEDVSRSTKNDLIDLYKFGVFSEDLDIYNKIRKILHSLKSHEKILLDEYILKDKSIATIRSEMTAKPSPDFLYKTIRNVKQKFREELNIKQTYKNKDK